MNETTNKQTKQQINDQYYKWFLLLRNTHKTDQSYLQSTTCLSKFTWQNVYCMHRL